IKLEKDLYAYLWQNPYENNCNTYVIKGEKTILIDPGHSRHVEKLFHQMEEDGIDPKKVDVVIITHSHPDHFEGFELFLAKQFNLQIHCTERRHLLESGKLLFEMMRQPLPKIRI